MFLKMSNFDPIEVATEAYIYVYPIVVMEITRQQYAAKTRSQHDANQHRSTRSHITCVTTHHARCKARDVAGH